MKLNKQALGEVACFLAIFLGICGYAFMAFMLSLRFGPGWALGGLSFPFILGASYHIYSESDAFDKPDADRGEKG